MPTAKKTNDNVTELEAFFAAKDRDTAPAWRPDPGTTMAGEVQGFRMGGLPANAGGYGIYPIVIYKLDDGNVVSVHAFHTLLQDQLRELKGQGKAKRGARHFIYYDGVKETNKSKRENEGKDANDKDRTKYHSYYVRDAADLSNEAEVEEELPDF